MAVSRHAEADLAWVDAVAARAADRVAPMVMRQLTAATIRLGAAPPGCLASPCGRKPKGRGVDTNEYPSLGRLARMNAQLAAQSARVEAIVAAQLDNVERLFRAATNHDWEAVARVSQDLARQPAAIRDAAVMRSAGKVCEALRSDPSGAQGARGRWPSCSKPAARRRSACSRLRV